MSLRLLHCPSCSSKNTVKNGKIHNGKQNHKCNDCGRQFVQDPQNKIIDEATKRLIDKLLLEKIPLAGIARVAEVSEVWLQQYVNAKYGQVPRQLEVSAKKRGGLTLECDEAWSFVANKANKQWIWLALDRSTREIVGVHIGDRSQEGAKALCSSLPPVYRQCAVCYSDFWQAYQAVLPSKRHRAVGKDSGQTNHIERFNCTLRQRVSRLVRKTLSFSKKLENHIGAIWFFIHHYNASLPL
ncbi:IS1 family transposase [Pseudanabaena sp. FACHB-2040]|uniref:IS1 family transposase n=1 Tax=Pseudanabaena sp. FACHB-2040 TaxID=2692859 RepID=UPI001685DEFA|nr:IS1 family transposase [Pseudanabaena sp. FACHB-2040]